MNPEEIYLQNLRTIEALAGSVAKSHHLPAHEAEEFIQEVRVRILDNDYAIIRKFEGLSKFSTYLHTVIRRLYSQWRDEQWGKWRPSAEAKRLGQKAVELERLLTSDGYTFAEAAAMLTTPKGSAFTMAELEAIYVRLPPRRRRPILVSDEALPESVAAEGDADERVESTDRERAARRCARALDSALTRFPAEDLVILQMRFWHACTAPQIARALQLDQKRLYKRMEKMYAYLRRELEKADVSRGDIDRLLVKGDQEIQLELIPASGISAPGHSHESSEEDVRGEGRPR